MKGSQNFESVAIQGQKGAYAHIMARKLLPSHTVLYLASFEDVFEAFLKREIAIVSCLSGTALQEKSSYPKPFLIRFM